MTETIIESYNIVLNNLENEKLALDSKKSQEIADLKASKEIEDISTKCSEIDAACENACQKIRDDAELQVQTLVAKADMSKNAYRTKVYNDIEASVNVKYEQELKALNDEQDFIRKRIEK